MGTSAGVLEVIVPPPGTAVRWHTHGYPDPLARWHHHPEVEFHLIREGTGQMMVGDALVPFGPGQVSLLGSNVPHNWLSDLAPGEELRHRDVVCQVGPDPIRALADLFPEAARFSLVLERARHGLVLAGASSVRAADRLESMGRRSPTERLGDLVALLAIFAEAPAGEWRTVVTPGYSPGIGADVADRVNTVIGYISANLGGPISLGEAASLVGMSESAFSRFFHRSSGVTFSTLVRRLRISRACHLLVSTDLPVSQIQYECGYSNGSNFHRRFLEEIGMTPSGYRRAQES
jgi:AraC-like DNA-binding protein